MTTLSRRESTERLEEREDWGFMIMGGSVELGHFVLGQDSFCFVLAMFLRSLVLSDRVSDQNTAKFGTQPDAQTEQRHLTQLPCRNAGNDLEGQVDRAEKKPFTQGTCDAGRRLDPNEESVS